MLINLKSSLISSFSPKFLLFSLSFVFILDPPLPPSTSRLHLRPGVAVARQGRSSEARALPAAGEGAHGAEMRARPRRS
jgi:hypothetical protein